MLNQQRQRIFLIIIITHPITQIKKKKKLVKEEGILKNVQWKRKPKSEEKIFF